MEKETKTLKQVIEYYGGNGAVIIDCGNGSAGPRWLALEDMDEDTLDIEMIEQESNTDAYDPDLSDCQDTLLEAVRGLGGDLATYPDNDMYASEWISSDQHPGYTYKIIF